MACHIFISFTFPCLQTIRLENTSGTDVPTAKKDRPITVSGTPIVNPMIVIIQVTKYEMMPIHEIQSINDSGANLRRMLGLQHFTACSLPGKESLSLGGALKNQAISNEAFSSCLRHNKLVQLMILIIYASYLRTSGIVRKNRISIGKNNSHHTCLKNPPSGRSHGYLGGSSSSSSPLCTK